MGSDGTYDHPTHRFGPIGALVGLTLSLFSVVPATAQEPPSWSVVAGGMPPITVAVDSANVREQALASLHRVGRLFARIDSIDRVSRRIFVTPGPAVPVSRIEWRAADGLPVEAAALRERLDASVRGSAWNDSTFSVAVRRLLEGLEALAYPNAEVRVVSAALSDPDSSVVLALDLVPGVQPVLEGILLGGLRRTRPGTVARLLGLRVGSRISRFDAEGLRAALAASGLFDDVRLPVLVPTGDSTAVVQIFAVEVAPGSFDAALGYQSGAGGVPAGLVGTGRLDLLSPFGAGRRLSMLLDRLPGQTSRVEAGVLDPAVLGSMVGAEAAFRGLQQDSTYSRRSWRFGVLFAVAPRILVTGSWTAEVTRPGSGGLHEDSAVARADGSFFGVGVRFSAIDDRVSPGRGAEGTVDLERGWVTRFAAPDATGRVRFERLSAAVRVYRPAGVRLVIAAGLDGALLVARSFDRSDLLRLGGARTLRGYDEDRFRGRAVGRALAEARYRVDRRSYAYLFAEAGFVDVPPGMGVPAGLSAWPGFGFGAQLETAAGLVLATYGFNPDDGPTRGRVHVRFSFGL